MALQRCDIEKLFTELERPLYNLAYRWLWNEQEASELVQETFISLWKRRKHVDIDTAKAYTYRICLNLCKNKKRRNSLFSMFSFFEEEAPSTPEESFNTQSNKKFIKEAIESLPEKLKQTIALTEVSELSYAEAAEVLEVPIGTVGSRRNQAMALLKEKLEEYK